ncbi:MAG: hypothetical protein NT155_04285 [Candidatus Staskawiczbacteria bacterium]|nr:hypothetical protein [Candidatus Staskawiczbacteria bacterium]
MKKRNIVVSVELPQDDRGGPITPGWEIVIKIGRTSFSLDERMDRGNLSKAKAIRIGLIVAERIGAEFKLIE